MVMVGNNKQILHSNPHNTWVGMYTKSIVVIVLIGPLRHFHLSAFRRQPRGFASLPSNFPITTEDCFVSSRLRRADAGGAACPFE